MKHSPTNTRTLKRAPQRPACIHDTHLLPYQLHPHPLKAIAAMATDSRRAHARDLAALMKIVLEGGSDGEHAPSLELLEWLYARCPLASQDKYHNALRKHLERGNLDVVWYIRKMRGCDFDECQVRVAARSCNLALVRFLYEAHSAC